eukprot:evm.model.NODE_41563_length_16898_cov_26.495798.2
MVAAGAAAVVVAAVGMWESRARLCLLHLRLQFPKATAAVAGARTLSVITFRPRVVPAVVAAAAVAVDAAAAAGDGIVAAVAAAAAAAAARKGRKACPAADTRVVVEQKGKVFGRSARTAAAGTGGTGGTAAAAVPVAVPVAAAAGSHTDWSPEIDPSAITALAISPSPLPHVEPLLPLPGTSRHSLRWLASYPLYVGTSHGQRFDQNRRVAHGTREPPVRIAVLEEQCHGYLRRMQGRREGKTKRRRKRQRPGGPQFS